ncbi:MAG TPA: HEPN domain-containing protein [Candidatus Lokiarchaeia archaeon]|nr:HEPN domain-containing protein [Candidatus Lokiarchaeia archaeon]
MKQAEADLVAAGNSKVSMDYNWSCFQAQQAGEKALKTFLYDNGYTSIITPSLKELVMECERIDPAFSTLKSDAKTLDAYYISTRYPNGLGGDLPPSEYFEEDDAEKCISCATSILDTVMPYFQNSNDSSTA